MRYVRLCMIARLMLGCEPKTKSDFTHFFSLSSFFEQEAARLSAQSGPVTKQVQYNSEVEQKQTTITDWKNELSAFSQSDINKPAWRDSYRMKQDGMRICYEALDSTLRTRSICIQKNVSGKATQVDIVNQTSNMLYQSREQLVYIPDSLYRITKQQHVIFIGDNRYQISGRFQ